MGNLLLEKVRPSQVGRKLTAATLVLNDHKDTWTLGPDSQLRSPRHHLLGAV